MMAWDVLQILDVVRHFVRCQHVEDQQGALHDPPDRRAHPSVGDACMGRASGMQREKIGILREEDSSFSVSTGEVLFIRGSFQTKILGRENIDPAPA